MTSANPAITNRADLLRNKRGGSRGRQTRMTQMARKPVKTQPVMVRNVSQPAFRSNVRVAAATQPRRQIYYSLGATGAELRLPALPVINPGWRMLSGLLAVFLALALYTLMNGPLFAVQQLDIVGLQRVNPAEIESLLNITNASIVTIQPDLIASQIARAFPEFSSVDVTVAFPAFVGITVTERQPVMAWQMPDQTLWIDAEGTLIPARGEPAEPLPTITANGLPPLVAETSPSEVDELTLNDAKIDQEANPQPSIWGRQVERKFIHATEQLRPYVPEGANLVYDVSSGLGWMDPRGWQVFVGLTLDNIELKLVEYQAVVEHLNQQGIIPSMISVEHVHAPFYRMEP